MTDCFNFRKKDVLVLDGAENTLSEGDYLMVLHDLSHCGYDQVELTGTALSKPSDQVRAILKKAYHHGLDIIDSTPPGSKLNYA